MAVSAATPFHRRAVNKGMALATRCPHCKTTFRVASDQLKLRGGIVRCGTCNQVFDGNATLVDLDAPAASSPPAVPEIPAWLARHPDPVPSEPAASAPTEPATTEEAPIPAWLARAMDAEVKVEAVPDIAFEPIVFKRDGAPAPAVTPETAPEPEAAPAPKKFDLIIEPDLLTDAIGPAETAPVADAWQVAAPLPADAPLAEPEPAAEPEPLLAEAPLFAAEPEAAPVEPPLFAAEAVPVPDEAPLSASEPAAPLADAPLFAAEPAPAPAEPAPLPEAPAAIAPVIAPTPAVPPVLDFDLSQDPDPAPVYDQNAFASPSAAVDADFAAFDDPLPMRLPRGYVLDYDLSDPPGWVADAPPPPPPPPARAPAFEPGPDTELGPLYETEEETHYDLDLEQPPVDELLELSVADEVEFSSADAHSQLPPLAAAPEPEPEPVLEAEPESEPTPEPALETPAPEAQPDLESGPLPLLRESAAPDPAPADDAVPVAAPVRAPEPEPEHDEPEFVRLAREKELASRRRTLMLGVGTVLLALTLLVQGVTTFRDVLAARYPALKPALTSACALLGCKVELPAQLDALKIEAPELQSLGNNTFVLTTLLRNESGLVQAWPHIHLELTDSDEKPLVRRVFTPAQYLPATVAPAKGFGATSEQAVKIHFELKQLTASGYHVAVFYP
jgi:predicted Zn finger-like uncharacterized protein